MALMVVGDTTEKLVAGVDPNRTDVTSTKLAPVMVTEFPPAADPEDGLRNVMVGPRRFEEE